MRQFLIHGYSIVNDKKINRTYRGKFNSLPDSEEIIKGGVTSSGKNKRSWNSIKIKGETSKQGDAKDNDVELLLYDLDMNDCTALILKLFEMLQKAEAFS